MDFLTKIFRSSDDKKLLAKRPEEDFVPYVAHYDHNTIITKNGELLQVIRVIGFGKESMAQNLFSLRDSVRDAIADNIKENKFAFWCHTIRRKKNIVPEAEFPEFFSKKIHDDWNHANQFDEQYVNELYISIIIEGIDTSIMNLQSFSRSFSYSTTQNLHKNSLAESNKKLKEISLKILAEIEEFGAKLLGIKEWEGILYSEPMRFFGKIANLCEERYPLSVNDISNDLTNHKIAFGQRELEVITAKTRNFAAILSLKEYHEVGTESLDKILQLPFEFIISQSFDFSFNKKDLEHYEYQDYLLKLSGDEDLRQQSGISNLIESNHNRITDYGKLQTTFMIISKEKDNLEKDIAQAVEKFSSLGYVLIREDVFAEHCFWAQLPGNFAFLRRQKIINSLRIAGFAALHSFPTGSSAGNHWGNATALLSTALDTPYFFNFHDKDLGHTLILGPKKSGKTCLTNFLLANSRKFDNRIFYFDLNKSSKTFIKALAGNYYHVTNNRDDEDFLPINPFSMNKNAENAAFISNWIQHLLMFLKGDIPEHEIEAIPEIINQVMSLENPNFISAFNAFNTAETRVIYKKLKIWNSENLGNIFASHTDIDWSYKINAFDLTEIIDQKPVLIPVLEYLLHRIEENLDGKPTIIVFDEAWEMLDNPIIAPDLHKFLQKMRQKNSVVIFMAQNNDIIEDSQISSVIAKNIASEIYFPSDELYSYYKTIFKLSDDEFEVLKMVDDEKIFLLKHRGDSLIINFNFEKIPEILKILSADEITLAATEEVIETERQSNPEGNLDPKNWTIRLIEILKEIEKERLEEEKRIAKEQAAAILKKQQSEEENG